MQAWWTNPAGTITATTNTATYSYDSVDSSAANAYLWVGDSWFTGPSCTFKDVRYYHTNCVDETEVNAIHA